MVRQLQLRPHQSGGKRLSYLRKRLLDQRRNLQGRLLSWMQTHEDASGLSGDTVDMASKGLELETDCQLVTAESEAIAEINQALLRIDNGTYGVCEVCGKPIPYSRLRVLPFASLCVACQQEEEITRQVAGESDDETWEDADGYEPGDHRELEEAFQTVRGTTRF